MKLNRRSFLQIAGMMLGTGLVYRLAPARQASLAPISSPETAVLGPNRQVVSTVCQQCEGGCGMAVHVANGRAFRVEGSPEFPVNRGRMCPMGQAALQVLYDPDRIRWPLRRVGDRGAGEWERISWPDALNLVGERLSDLRSRGEPHTLVALRQEQHSLSDDLLRRFIRVFGSPNDIVDSRGHLNGSQLTHLFTQGSEHHPAYDIARANYVLSFGAPFAEGWGNMVENALAYSRLRDGHAGHFHKVVQVDTRLSVSAARADEWIPVTPGTDGALALGIAHVLVKGGLYDAEFVRERTFGFEDWVDGGGAKHEGLKTLLLRDYPPEKVSAITGVADRTITRLAAEFATNGPALAIGGSGAARHSNGLYNLLAIQTLNALGGHIGRPGGVLTLEEPPLAPFPDPSLDAVAQRGLAQPRLDRAGTSAYPLASSVSQGLPDSILQAQPYPVNVLLLYHANPLFDRPSADRFRAAFTRVPFIVSFSPFLDESTEQADLVLPDSTFLEKLEYQVVESKSGRPMVGLRQPVVPPLYDTASMGDIVLALSRHLAGPVASAFPWSSSEGALKERVSGLHAARRGSIVAASFDEFWNQLREKGVWWDERPSGAPVFRTPSQRYEFYVQGMRQRLEMVAQQEARQSGRPLAEEKDKLLASLGLSARGDDVYLPHYEAPAAPDDPTYPFHLNTFHTITMGEGRPGNQPWLLEITGLQVRSRWDSWVEINPHTARELGIAEGDPVWVESAVGKIKSRARLFPGAMPQVVNMPLGLGHGAGGRWARGRGANPNLIMTSQTDSLGGIEARFSTRVKVYKA